MTPTAVLNAHLPETATAASLLVLGALVVRIAQLLVGLWIDALPLPSLRRRGAKRTLLQRFAGLGLVSAAVNFASAVLMSLARLAVAALHAMCTVVWALLPLVMLALLLALAQSRWADAMQLLTGAFNGPVGSTLRWALLAPLTLLDFVGQYVVPLWNLGWLVLFHMPLRFVGWLLSGSGAVQLVYALRELAAAPAPFMQSAAAFAAANLRTDCGGDGLAPALAAQACLDPKLRELDFVPAARHVQLAATHVVLSLSGSCGALGLLLNATLFPLTDASLWYAGDRLLNAALAALVVAPSSAALRCGMAGGMALRPAMCTPDFAPAFRCAAEAALRVGEALTHWMDAVYLWVRALLAADAAAPDLWPWQATAAFGGNATALVRLSGTDAALTDGTGVLWLTGKRWTLAPDVWPLPVDTRYGIARVRLGAAQDGLLGCACSGRVELVCAIVTPASSSNETAWVLPGVFSLAAESQRLAACDRVRINVQSLRWAQARIAVQRLAPALPQVAATGLVAADAAVYVTPICGAQAGGEALACLPEASYTHGICFPYCLGVRFTDGFRPLQLRGAAEWTQGVVLANTDCSAAPSTAPAAAGGTKTVCRVAADVTLPTADTAVDGSVATCSYATTCVSALADKAMHGGYGAQTAAPAAADGGDARLLLDGQPLAIGGGVQLRAYQPPNATARFDFPTLVGNQRNEFTVEPANPDGVNATTPPPATPSEQTATARQPTIDMPPLYVPSALPYNPGALARGALWYASNPSYAAFDALLRYCATGGRDVALAVMFLSSYAPLRVQRVLTAQDNCFVNANLGMQPLCADDLFTAQVLPDTLPVLTGAQAASTDALYDLCVSQRPFDLYAEGLEYWDDANMVVAVRQGTVAEAAALLTQGNASAGRTAYRFVQSADITQIRADVPWPTSALGTPASSFDSVLLGGANASVQGVPTANLPDLGGWVGHSLAAMIRALGVVANACLNPFAFPELLDARWAGTCPDDALRHSAMESCGMGLLSLDEVFADIYAASHAFWDAVVWVANLVFPSDAAMPSVDVLGRPVTAATLRHFLEGLSVVGDATHIEVLFASGKWVSAFDTGAERVLEQGQRRLLQAEDEAGGGGGFKMGLLRGMFGGIKSGVRGFGSLAHLMLSVLVSPPFSGADFSALLATQSPVTHTLGGGVSAPPVALAEFTYKAALPIVLDAIASVRAGQPSVASVWQHLGATRDLFDDIVDQRLRQACAGLRVALGYDSQIATTAYYACRAAADMGPAMLQVLTTVFADMTLYRCLCVHPAGEDYLAYVQAQCVVYIPPTRKAFWLATLAAASTGANGGVPGMCETYLEGIQAQAQGALDDWSAHTQAAGAAMAGVLDELFSGTSGRCVPSPANPGAIVLTPLPSTHYQVCGQTTQCQARCAAPIAIFDAELQRTPVPDAPPSSVTQTVESPLFNVYASADSSQSLTVVAFATQSVPNATDGCRTRCGSKGGDCLAVVRQQGLRLQLDFFCVPDPSYIAASVFPTTLDGSQLAGSDTMQAADGYTFQHVEVLWPPRAMPWVVAYTSRALTTVAFDGTPRSATNHEIWAWRAGTRYRVLGTDDLAAEALTVPVQRALFDGSTLLRVQTGVCAIGAAVTVAADADRLVVFLAFSLQVGGVPSAPSVVNSDGSTPSTMSGYQLHSIASWSAAGGRTSEYHAPCAAAAACTSQALDDLLRLAQDATLFVVPESNTFMLVDSGSATRANSGGLYMRGARIAPERGLVWTDSANAQRLADDDADTMALLGTWTRGALFSSLAGALQKPIRDTRMRGRRWFQASGQSTTSIGAWMHEVRGSVGGRGWVLRAFATQQTTATSVLTVKCSVHSCTGCATARLRLLCHQAQDCILSQCVGTVVQTRNVLCGMGSVIEQTARHALTTWRALYAALVELGLLVVRGRAGDLSGTIALHFPTDQVKSVRARRPRIMPR